MGLGPCLLLILVIIGTAAAASSQTTPSRDARHDARVLRLELPVTDQRALGVCLHMYLERDFPGIERIVYPYAAKSPQSPQRSTATPTGDGWPGRQAPGSNAKVLVDGPSLEANCQQLYRLVRCFSRSMGRMQYYEDFGEFRRLVVALDAVLLELCGAVDLMRHRFLPLLQTLSCIERVRESEPCPYKDRLPPNIWHQLIRLEADSSLCWPMMRQLNCVRDSMSVRRTCGDSAQQLFANLSSVFLGHWCLNAAGAPCAPHVSPLVLLLCASLSLLRFLSA